MFFFEIWLCFHRNLTTINRALYLKHLSHMHKIFTCSYNKTLNIFKQSRKYIYHKFEHYWRNYVTCLNHPMRPIISIECFPFRSIFGIGMNIFDDNQIIFAWKAIVEVGEQNEFPNQLTRSNIDEILRENLKIIIHKFSITFYGFNQNWLTVFVKSVYFFPLLFYFIVVCVVLNSSIKRWMIWWFCRTSPLQFSAKSYPIYNSFKSNPISVPISIFRKDFF